MDTRRSVVSIILLQDTKNRIRSRKPMFHELYSIVKEQNQQLPVVDVNMNTFGVQIITS